MTDTNQQSKTDSPPPDAIMMQMLFGALMQKSICVAARLGIADLLAERPQTAEELAVKTETHAPSLFRVLRALASRARCGFARQAVGTLRSFNLEQCMHSSNRHMNQSVATDQASLTRAIFA